jgi:(p)ppGpp synthase/HD superfamily hydrolase
MMNVMEHPMVKAADEFAAKAHGDIGQVRKYTGEPYIVHPREVAATLANMGFRAEVVAAALLHDTVEDTPVTVEDIVEVFGPEVAKLVWEVTDQSRLQDGNRKVRKEIDRKHLARASGDGQSIKLADLLNNLSSIFTQDKDFSKVIYHEVTALLPNLGRGNPKLYAQVQSVLDAYRAQSR